MATRANEDLIYAMKKTTVVKAGQIVTAGYPIKRDGTGAQNCAAGDLSCGIALEDGIAGQTVSYVPVAGNAIVKARVGTGGATEGKFLVAVANGVADAPTLGGGTVAVNVVGLADQTGVAGDLIGIIPLAFTSVRA